MPASALPAPLPIPCRSARGGALDARVRPPGSRSLTNRALLAAALARGESVLSGATESDDAGAMREGLRALGVPIRGGGRALAVTGCAGRLPATRPRGRGRTRLGHHRALPHGSGHARARRAPRSCSTASRACASARSATSRRRCARSARASRRSARAAARPCACAAAASRAARSRSTRGARASTCRACCWPRPAPRATSRSRSSTASWSRAPSWTSRSR